VKQVSTDPTCTTDGNFWCCECEGNFDFAIEVNKSSVRVIPNFYVHASNPVNSSESAASTEEYSIEVIPDIVNSQEEITYKIAQNL
jgi:hypothetical protein